MKSLYVLIAALLYTSLAFSQNSFNAVIKDGKTNEVLTGANVLFEGSNLGGITNTSGNVTISSIPAGKHVIQFRFMGYETRFDTLTFPLVQQEPIVILLNPEDEAEESEEVTITATRGTRTISNIPTRVEVIDGEELDEKGNMKPGDIRMLLAESTGIQTQQTSATSANSSIRIQGLDGKYTQIIRDGFPLYSGFSGGLGLLQIAPLDLQQVEVIKGSASTLYGGGAIAGLVNLVSKTPTDERQMNFMLNGTSAKGLDASMFYAQKFNRLGTTVFAAYNYGNAYDPASIGLTAIPKFNRFTLNPKLYVYINDRTNFYAGINGTVENRIGGDVDYIEGRGSTQHSYFEENKTDRFSTQAQFDHKLNDKEKLTFKNSVSYFDRSIALPDYRFSGIQFSSYSEANYSRSGEKADWVAGVNYWTEKFSENKAGSFPVRDYNYKTIGGFVQNTWDIAPKFTLESGLRGDYHNEYGFFLLPRLSAMLKLNEHFTTRLGGGFGYKAPSVFTEDAERIQFRNVLPINISGTKAERSFGANYDVNYRTRLFDNAVGFSINHMFFYTRINNPILLTALADGNPQYIQPAGNVNTRGMETNVKLTYADFKLFIGYTFADVRQDRNGTSVTYPLVSKNRLNNVLMYEIEEKWKIGLEAYYFSPQHLSDGTIGKSYWIMGFMAEKLWEHFSVFANFENFTDTRQTRFGNIYTGSITSPTFKEIYAPLDGFVVNGGLKLRL
ncbi:MAG: TonB-dependent receptor [Bacteroidota bacterium]